MMPHYSQEEIEKARKMDLYTYLRLYEPEELVRVNSREFCTRTHDSLKISNGMWMWWSRQIGGRSALDYLVKVRGKPFAEAVQIINGQEAVRPPVFLSEQSQEVVRKLLIPDQSKRNDEVIRYLESRCIDDEIIDYCIDNGLLYESKKFHSCIFLGFDEQLKARYAFYRSTTGSRDMGEASGSDKRFSFRLGDVTESIHVFEGILDLLSYATISKMRGIEWKKIFMLSLGGVHIPSGARIQQKLPIALRYQLDEHPEIKTICLHLDNDRAGEMASAFIRDELKDRYRIRDAPPSWGKDYNEYLQRGGR